MVETAEVTRSYTLKQKNSSKLKYGANYSFFFRIIFFRQTKILYDDDFLRQQQQLELYSTWLPVVAQS